eukprot:230341-Chlamydomonas_euryale.AAC.1
MAAWNKQGRVTGLLTWPWRLWLALRGLQRVVGMGGEDEERREGEMCERADNSTAGSIFGRQALLKSGCHAGAHALVGRLKHRTSMHASMLQARECRSGDACRGDAGAGVA